MGLRNISVIVARRMKARAGIGSWIDCRDVRRPLSAPAGRMLVETYHRRVGGSPGHAPGSLSVLAVYLVSKAAMVPILRAVPDSAQESDESLAIIICCCPCKAFAAATMIP